MQTYSSKSFGKQFLVNLISNMGYFVLSIVIGIWMVPYLIKHLGVNGYGFIPLVFSVTAYVSLVTLSLNGAVTRYLVLVLQKDDREGANRIMSTALWSTVFVLSVFLPLFGIFAWLAPRIFNVPPNLVFQVQGLFFLALLSFNISIFSSVFLVSTFASNRLDLRNLIDLSNLVIRTVFIVLFFTVFSANLIYIGVAYIIGGLISLGLGYLSFRKLTPAIKISRDYFDFSRLKELTAMGGWLVINLIGTLMFVQIDLIVVNLLFGAEQTGKYGAIIQLSFLLRALAGVMASALAPIIFISSANNGMEKIVSITKQAIKFMGLGIAIPVSLLCSFSYPFLTLWLGKDFTALAPLLWISTFHLVINLAVLPIFNINNAFNRLKIPGQVTLVMGITNLLLAIILSKWTSLGFYGIAVAGAIVLTLKNTLFTPIYAAHVLKIPFDDFIKPIGPGIYLVVVNIMLGWIFNRIIMINNWFGLFAAVSLTLLFSLPIGILLLGKDRTILASFLKIKNRRMPGYMKYPY